MNISDENRRLREIVAACADALGNGAFISTSASIEFMEKLPDEIAAVRASFTAALAAAPANAEPVKVKPLDDSKNTGWHDDNGRFCLPMSDGYYIKFPKDGEAHSLFAVWYHNTPIGAASLHKDAQRIAQDHHEHRIRSAILTVDT